MLDSQGRSEAEQLADMADSPGFHKYARLMHEKFGGDADQYLPYLLAAALDVATLMWAESLMRLREAKTPLEMLGAMAVELGAVTEMQDLADKAAKAVGFDHRESADEFLLHTIDDEERPQ